MVKITKISLLQYQWRWPKATLGIFFMFPAKCPHTTLDVKLITTNGSQLVTGP